MLLRQRQRRPKKRRHPVRGRPVAEAADDTLRNAQAQAAARARTRTARATDNQPAPKGCVCTVEPQRGHEGARRARPSPTTCTRRRWCRCRSSSGKQLRRRGRPAARQPPGLRHRTRRHAQPQRHRAPAGPGRVHQRWRRARKVTLEVSTGKVKLPDVSGKKYDDAQTQLNNVGFTNIVQSTTPVPRPTRRKDGTVERREPGPGRPTRPTSRSR